MGKVYFDAQMSSIKTEVESACDNIASNPCSKLQSEVQELSSSIGSISVPSWNDSAQSSFEQIKSSVISDLESVVSSVSSTFASAESTYKDLKSKLEKLQDSDSKYQDHIKKEPKKENYREAVYNDQKEFLYYTTSSRYQRDYNIWLATKRGMEQTCETLIDNIESLVATLDGIGWWKNKLFFICILK